MLLLLGVENVLAADVTFTTVVNANGFWTAGTNWAGGVAASGAGNIGLLGAGGSTFILDAPTTMGNIRDGQGSARAWTILTTNGIAMTMDNTGGTIVNNAGDLNAYIGSSSSGPLNFGPSIIIQNTDLDIQLSGSTQPAQTIGVLGTTTITATSARNLIFLSNLGGAAGITVNSAIAPTGSSITISNMGTGTRPVTLVGVVGPNASIVQNSANSVLRLNNAANTYTNVTIITAGTLQLGVVNGIPAVSSVDVDTAGILNMANFSGTIGGLNGVGIVDNTVAGTPTFTMGGNNGSGTFSGVIQNTAGTLSVTKTGSGTQILSGQNTYTGTTTINGGFLNAGAAVNPGVSGPFGSANIAGSILFGGGALQYSVANQNDYSARFSTAGNQPISIDLAGQNVTFNTLIQGNGTGLKIQDSVGGGTLTIPVAETYTGNTTVNGGILALTGSGALASNSTINIGAGGTFDVSALASPYTLGAAASLKGSGTGSSIGTTAANIKGASGGVINLGSRPVSVTWGGAASGTDSTHPALLVSQGTLNFSDNTITVVVPGTPLDVGVYTLISAPSITGIPHSTPTYTGGNGVVLGNSGVISVSGSTVILTVIASGGTLGTWSNDVDGNWSDPTKWSSNPNVPHLPGDVAFLGVGSALRTVTLNANQSVGVLVMTNANSFVIANGGNALTMDNAGSGALVIVNAGSANAIQTAVGLNGDTVVTVGSGKSLSISGVISNTSTARTLIFNGAGTNILSGVNSYGPSAGSMGTEVNGGGILQLGNNNALGAGDLSMANNSRLKAGTALTIANNIDIADLTTFDNNGNDVVLNGTIGGAGGISKISNGKLTLSGTNTYAGNTTVNTGVLSISSSNNVLSSPTVVLNGGSLLVTSTFAANNNIGVGPAAGVTGGTALIDAASGQTITLNGIIASAGNTGTNHLTVNSGAGNNGTVVLAGANTFNGTTIISNGTLQVANSLALQTSVLNYNSGTLNFGIGITAATLNGLFGTNSSRNLNLISADALPVQLTVGANNVSTIYGGQLSGTGALLKLGSGTLTLSNATYTGNTTVNGGILTIAGGASGSASSTILVGNGVASTLIVTGGSIQADTLNIATIANSTGSGATISGTASGTFNNVNMASTANTGGNLTVNTVGTVSLGVATFNRDAGGNSAVANTTAGLIINNGTVTATSFFAASTTAQRPSDLNLNGGSFIIGDSVSAGAFALATAAGNGFVTQTNGTLTYLGTDGLLMNTSGGANVSGVRLVGGTANLTGITLNQNGISTSTLVVSNAATLYLGSIGLVINQPGATVFASLGSGGTLGALADWTSVAPITLSGVTTIKAADASAVAHNITLAGNLSGTGGFIKSGGGILDFAGTNSYSGATTVSNGIVRINGTSGSSAVTVLTNATLGGSGTIAGNVSVNNGGHTLPGGNLGNVSGLTTTFGGSLTYIAGAQADFNLSSLFNGSNDRVVVAAGGTLNGNGVKIGIRSTGGGNLDASGLYSLVEVYGTRASGFNPVPVWLETPPANSNLFSVVLFNNGYALSGSPISFATATASPSPASRYDRVSIAVNATAGIFTINPNTGIYVDVSALGGASQLFLVQSNGTSIYTNSVIVAAGTPLGSYALKVTVTDSNGDVLNANIPLNIVLGAQVWSGNGSPNNTWGLGANWVNGAPPSPGDFVVFAGTTQLTPNMDTSYSLLSVSFQTNAGAFTITNENNTLTLTGGGVTNNSLNLQTLNVPIALSSMQTFNAASNGIVVGGIVSDAVAGSGLIKAGTNTLTLTRDNTYTGPTLVNAGRLVLSGANYSGTPVTNSATLQLANSFALNSSPLALNNGSTLQLRSDVDDTFYMASLAVQNAGLTLGFDVGPLTSAVGRTLTLSATTLPFTSSSDQTINVTGNSSYTLTLANITTITTAHAPYRSLNISALAGGAAVNIPSITVGDFGNYVNMKGGGKITVTGDLGNTSNGSVDLFVNDGTTVTLLGSSIKTGGGDAYRYAVQNGTLVLDSSGALLNNTTGTGLSASYFILGASTNVFTAPAPGVLVTNNNSFNAAVYLGDANNPSGGLATPATLTNNVSNGDIGFTNSGVFVIGGQNTSGVNTYANPIILGLTANRGKSVTLVAATGGEVDFTGNILRNGTDTTAGIAVGDAAHGGIVRLTGQNNYAGATTISNGVLALAFNGATDGSISNSANILINSAATLDVTGRSDGTFQLGTGAISQTLRGNGTVNGNLNVGTLGTVAPGVSVGTLNVNGNVTLSGTLAMELNRTNTPSNCDRLTATGSITYGGTLTVTNIGPALQANDTFQLFATGVSGFTAINIAPKDANFIYTWQTNIATLGSITVLSVAPVMNTNPATANFTFVSSGGSLQFSWAPDHLGWQLYTNSVSLTDTNSWFPIPGSAAVTNITITINTAQPKVFFQLRYP